MPTVATTTSFLARTTGFLRDLPGWDYLPRIYTTLKVIFIILDVILLGIFIFAFVKSLEYRPHLELTRKTKSEGKTLKLDLIQSRWKKILQRKKEGNLDSLRIAIIEADALVDDVLKQKGVPGEHMADRLSNLDTEDLPSIEKLWGAHRLRNDLVHTSGFFVSTDDTARTLEDYQTFLKELGVLN
ncbi:MAG: hypothetical protein V1856_03155 [Candidatus Liptonbacteria bacterium]